MRHASTHRPTIAPAQNTPPPHRTGSLRIAPHHPSGHTASPCLDNGCMAIAIPTRHDLVRRGQQLEYFTIAYNSAEGLVSTVAGIVAGSVSLIGFGLDSLESTATTVAVDSRLS